MITKRWLILKLVAVFALSTLFWACAPSAPDYPSKPIKWIIPTPPGGGFDAYTRIAAKWLPKYLPKQVDVIPENIPGAAFITATNHVYAAAPDGYTIGTASLPDLISNQIMRGEVAYDIRKMTPIGILSSDIEFIAVNPKTPYRTLEDLQKADEVKMAVTSVGGLSWLNTILMTKELGIKAKLVSGYKGGKAQMLATIRGDTDATIGSGVPILDPGARGDLRLILHMGTERHSLAPNVPTAVELGYPKEVINSGGKFWRVVFGPPDMPEEIAKVLQDALWKALHDDELLAEAKKQRRPIIPGNVEDLQAVVDNSFKAVEKYLDVIKAELGK